MPIVIEVIPKKKSGPTTRKKLKPKTKTKETKRVKGRGGYATGGSVSRGQYPKQTQKVKFKGVF